MATTCTLASFPQRSTPARRLLSSGPRVLPLTPVTMSWEIKYAMEREKRLIVVKEGTVDEPCDVPPI